MNRPVRNELKYIVSHQERSRLLDRWRRHLRKDPHANEDGVTPILSQYYDSPHLKYYEEKLDGVGRMRSKIRLRTYGTEFLPGQATFLEIKQRIWDRVCKIREQIDFQPGDLNPDNWRFSSAENENAFRVLLLRDQLRQSAQVWYRREAYQCTVEPDVRVTIDSCLTALFPRERMTRAHLSDPARRCMSDELFILEVKSNRDLPAWVHHGIQLAELVQMPVPKYIMCVEKLQLHHTNLSGVYV